MEKVYRISKRFEQTVVMQFVQRKDSLYTVRMYVLKTKNILELKGGFTEDFWKKDLKEKRKEGYKVEEISNNLSFLIH